MGLKKLKYTSLGDLLGHERIWDEDPLTAKIIERVRHAKRKKEFTRGEFLAMCLWKSPRSIRHCERNSARRIQSVSRRVFSTRSEKERIELLTSLHGVGIPTASAILTLTNPAKYGVIDIRVWQLLYRLGSVHRNARGQGFRFEQWLEYLMILRNHAKRLHVPVRLVELTLFTFHESHQKGTLYTTRERRSS